MDLRPVRRCDAALEHGLQKMSKRMETELGITGPQRLALRVVGQFPGLSAGELAGIVRLHPSTITGIVHLLVERGLLASGIRSTVGVPDCGSIRARQSIPERLREPWRKRSPRR